MEGMLTDKELVEMNSDFSSSPSPEEVRLGGEMDGRIRQELYDALVEQQRNRSSFLKRPIVSVLMPCCEDCYAYRQHRFQLNSWRPPDISPETWEDDLSELGVAPMEIERIKKQNYYGAISCSEESHDLAYDLEATYVESMPFEHYFSELLPDRLQKRRPPSWMKTMIWKAYDKKCFGCEEKLEWKNLTIDHIQPFNPPSGVEKGLTQLSNLQPLCDHCAQIKDDLIPEEEWFDLCFRLVPPPSDAWEGFVW